MEYQPLSAAADDIRLITIFPPKQSLLEESPVKCSIEHVRLPTEFKRTQTQPGTLFKGHNRIWPEAYAPWDVSVLFKDEKHPLATRSPQGSVKDSASRSAEIANEENLPWRHVWGDYVALSYGWGSSTPRRSIILNNHAFEVTENLYHALIQLRRSRRIQQGFKLWIDAICINQDDLQERSQQVARMRDIYASAWQVVVWTGPPADNSNLALTAMHWMARRMKDLDPFNSFYTVGKTIDARPLFIKWAIYRSPWRKEVYQSLYHFLLRSYWHRLWILQEVAMAREDGPIICGERCLLQKDIYDATMFISADEARLGSEIVGSVRPRLLRSWSWEFARDRNVEETPYSSGRMWRLVMKMMELRQIQNHSKRPIFTWDILQPLRLAREAEVTNDHDRVYGILGFKSISTQVNITPDYTLTLSEVYQFFTKELLLHGNFDVLRLVSRPIGNIDAGWTIGDHPLALNHSLPIPVLGPVLHRATASGKKRLVVPPCKHDLPSWAVCWVCKPPPVAQLTGKYCAGGTSFSMPYFSVSPPTLTLKVILLDIVTSLSSFHACESDRLYPINIASKISIASAYGDLGATRAALWRTITGNTTSAEEECDAPDCYSCLIDPRIWQEGVAGIYTNGFGLQEFMSRNKRLVLSGYTLRELITTDSSRWNAYRRVYNPTEAEREALSWAMNAMAWRRLVSTDRGRMGLATAAARAGDRVAVILGGSMPFLLRKDKDAWAVVGECYLHGIMEGEVMNADGDRPPNIVNIKLY